ncbi:MAG TPA: hypothetical protein VGA30_08905 [Actinomycetota bacterium]
MIAHHPERAPGRARVPEARRPRVGRELLPLLAGCVAGAGFYAGAFWIRHFAVPIGDDTFFYVNAIGDAGRLGLATSHLAARPAYPVMAAALGSIAGSSPWSTAVALPFAMATGVGLAGGSLAARWGLRRWSAASFVALVTVSVVLGRLVAGRSENLLAVWFLAAALAGSVWSRGRRGALAVGVLIAAAGLAEWPFLLAFLAIVGAALAVAWATARPGWWPRMRPVLRAEVTNTDREALTLPELAVVCVLAAAAVALVVFGWNGTVPADAVEKLSPVSRYESFLRATLPAYFPPLTTVVVAIGWWAARRRGPASTMAVRWLLATWALLTGGAVVAGLAGVPLPTYRALTFALPVALGLAAAPFLPASLGREARTPPARAAGAVLALALASMVAVPGVLLWYRDFGPRTSPQQLAQVAAAGRYAAALPGRGPVVVVYDNPDVLKALFYQGVFGAVLPANLRHRVLIFSGTAQDALANRLAPRGDPTQRATARALFDDARPALISGAPVVATRDLDPAGFLSGLGRGDPRIGDDVILRGPPPPPNLTRDSPDRIAPVPAGWVLLLRALAMLAVLVLAGAGWARLAAPGRSVAAQAGLSPSFGAAAIAVLGLVAARAGLPLGGWAGPLVVGLALAASGAAWVVRAPAATWSVP